MKSAYEPVPAPNAEELRIRSEILNDPGLADELKAEQAREKLRRAVPDVWSLKPPPISWVLRDLVARKAVTMIAGASGSRKTWFGLQLAKVHAHGGEMLGRHVSRTGDVLYVDRENPLSAMRDRLELIDFQQTARFFLWGLHCPIIPPTVDQVGAYIQIVKSFPTAPLLIFDTYIRFHSAESENDACAMAAVTAKFRAIAEAGPAIVIMHHQGRNGSNFRGSSEIQAGVDIFLTLGEREGAIRLDTVKNRLGAPVSLTVAFDLDEANGFTLTKDPVSDKREQELRIVTDLIVHHPGVSKVEIENQLRGQVGRTRIRELLESGSWVTKRGPERGNEALSARMALAGCLDRLAATMGGEPANRPEVAAKYGRCARRGQGEQASTPARPGDMKPETSEVHEFLAMLRSRGIQLSVVGDKVQIAAPPETSQEIIEKIRLQKPAIVRYLTADSRSPLPTRIFSPSGEVQSIDSGPPRLQFAGSPPPVREGEPGEVYGESLGGQKQFCWEGRANDPYWIAAREALATIDEAAPWPSDMGAWLWLHYPDVHRILFTTLPDEIDRTWNERAGLEAFVSALTRWTRTHHDALALRQKREHAPRR